MGCKTACMDTMCERAKMEAKRMETEDEALMEIRRGGPFVATIRTVTGMTCTHVVVTLELLSKLLMVAQQYVHYMKLADAYKGVFPVYADTAIVHVADKIIDGR